MAKDYPYRVQEVDSDDTGDLGGQILETLVDCLFQTKS